MPSISEINSLSPEAFINLLGGIFEHSPWVADSAEKLRPFSDLEALHAAMTGVVAGSPAERQLALIQAHPDLAGQMLFMPMYIYQQASSLQNWPFAAALSLVFLVAVLGCVSVLNLLGRASRGRATT